jgi:hypothetical protein
MVGVFKPGGNVRDIGSRRVATALAVAGTVFAVAATSTAAAATHPPRTAIFTPRMLASLAPRGGLLHRMAGLLPGASTFDLANMELTSDPVNVTVNGITYRMTMSVVNLPVAFDQPPELAIQLDRTVGGARITGEQDHLYGYAPLSGLQFTANSGLTQATVNTGSSIDPSGVDMQFNSTGTVEQDPCSLVGGGHGVFEVATGTLSATTFNIATATSPFFGTITTAPQSATVLRDPGCATFTGAALGARVAAGINAAAAPVFRPQCTGNTMAQSTLTSFWLSQRGFGGHHLLQVGMTETNPFGPDGVSHAAVGLGRGADMPPPVRIGKGRIRADIFTTGIPFMGGTAVFKSTAKAHVSPGHACTWERHTHHFTTTRYTGRLTPGSSPLELMFDTGAAPVKPTPTTLFVYSYAK